MCPAPLSDTLAASPGEGETKPKGNAMKTLRKMGGAAGLVASATFVVGLAMFVTMFTDYTTAEEPLRAVEFLIENQARSTCGTSSSTSPSGEHSRWRSPESLSS
jgi:hypothetical protein